MTVPRFKTVINWILTILLSAVFLTAGLSKLAGSEMYVSSFARWGYPLWFMYVVGAVETLGAVGLLVRRASPFALVSLGVVMAGAVGTHLGSGEGWVAVVPALVFILLTARWAVFKTMATVAASLKQ